MPYRFAFDPESRLGLVIFTGPIPFEEELRAFQEGLAYGYAVPGVRVVADRTEARLLSTPEQVQRQVDWMEANFPPVGARIAEVVPRDLDFGMLRMLELRSEGRLVQKFRVFRTLAEACAWLGVEEAALEALRTEPDADADATG